MVWGSHFHEAGSFFWQKQPILVTREHHFRSATDIGRSTIGAKSPPHASCIPNVGLSLTLEVEFFSTVWIDMAASNLI